MESPIAKFCVTRPVQLNNSSKAEWNLIRVSSGAVSADLLEVLRYWIDEFPDEAPIEAVPQECLDPGFLTELNRFLLESSDEVVWSEIREKLTEIGTIDHPYAEAETGDALEVLVRSQPFQVLEEHLSALVFEALKAADKPVGRLSGLLRCLAIMALLRRLPGHDSSFEDPMVAARFLLSASVLLPKGDVPLPGNALARPPAIADLLVIRQKIARYELGEIAHIETVLKSETKNRTHRRLDEREETTFVETETERVDERDNQTAERFELESETSKVVEQATSVTAGLEVSASYGPTVSLTASANVAVTWSQQEARRTATNYAKEITERAASRVRERRLERRSSRTSTTIEETNVHGFDNSDAASQNINGIYRWIDKVYSAQVYRYGRRLLLDFVVPEPGVFARAAFLDSAPAGVTLKEPTPPTWQNKPLTPEMVTDENYLSLSAEYFARDLSPPPASKTIAIAWDQSGERAANRFYFKARKELQIPDGYAAESFTAVVGASAWKSDISLCVGTTLVRGSDPNVTGGSDEKGGTPPLVFPDTQLRGERGDLPIALVILDVWEYAVNVVVKCKPVEATAQWRFNTYSAIMSAYFELKAEYDAQVSAAKTSRGVAIDGRNPLENEVLQRNELKRGIISMLMNQHFDKPPLDKDALVASDVKGGGKEFLIEFAVARDERDYIQWFEQAFEWTNITFVYYPYYWSRRTEWNGSFAISDADPLFKQFLSAGAARVQVPVRPGFEKAMTLFLASGWIWQGTSVPQVGDPLYVSILEELNEQTQNPNIGGVAVGEPWEIRLPTSFAVLQPDSELPVFE